LLFGFTLLLSACGRTFDPQSVYEDARMKLKRGETSPAFQETERALKRYPSEKTEWHWRFRVLKAEILHSQGLDRESLALLEAELPPSLAASDLAVRRKLTQGAACASTQRLNDADRYLAEAESLARANHPELLGEVSLKKGTVCFWRSDMLGAEGAYRKALAIAREQKNLFLEASALSGLGVAATKEGHFDESIDWNRAAIQLSRSLGAGATLGNTFGNMGWGYAELGDLENALAFYKQAEEVSAQNGRYGDRTYWLTSVAYVHQGLHDDVSAETILKQTLQLARAQDDKETLAQCLTQLSWIALRTGRNDLAETYAQESSKLKEKGLGPRLVIETRLLNGLIASSRGNYAEAEKALQEVIREPQAIKFQQWKGQAELAKVYSSEGQSAKAEQEFRHSLETIEGVRATLQTEELRLSFLFNTIAFFDDYVEFLISHDRNDDALEVANLSRARTLAEGLGATPKALSFPSPNFRPQEIARRSNAILLFYWLAPKNSLLWVIAPRKTTLLKLPPESEIDLLIKAYRNVVLGMRDAQDPGDSDGKKLYAALVEPAKKLIPHGSRVILLPDSNLYGLNFETLIVPEPQPHFWIEDVTATTASSLTVLASSAMQPTTKEKNLLLIGNTAQPNTDFPALTQAPAEMTNIERYFPGEMRKVLEGKQATPAAYLSSNPERFTYVHFVTHGTASRARPLESAVILSQEGDSYKLYARDIVMHRLNARLVTISACNGSGTRTYSGEGLVGLSWAFLRAGAHNVIGALWEVSDAATPQLMDDLYRELNQGKDPATALRDAKLSLLHSPDANSVFRKPFYWAPFQLYAGS
jgi:CHAT domain-containing protein